MYENEENGKVLGEDLATIFEVMLGVEEIELSALFLSLEDSSKEKITYGKVPVTVSKMHHCTNWSGYFLHQTVTKVGGVSLNRFTGRNNLSLCCYGRLDLPISDMYVVI